MQAIDYEFGIIADFLFPDEGGGKARHRKEVSRFFAQPGAIRVIMRLYWNVIAACFRFSNKEGEYIRKQEPSILCLSVSAFVGKAMELCSLHGLS